MIPRYTRDEMGRLWSEESKFDAWLEVEISVCRVLSEQGRIPADALKEIEEKAGFDIARIDEIEATVRHDVIAFLTCVEERVGPAARYIHMGLTSSDVVDTAQSLRMVRALDLVLQGVDALSEVLARQADRYRHTLQVGRTHGIHAEPMTFGLKLALWYREMARNQTRLERARETIAVGKLSGAVGTFSQNDPDLEERVCGLLGLRAAEVSTQVIQRDRYAEVLAALSICAATVEKIAVEIRGLQRTDIHEVEEPFGKGQKGSSAMPHKRNPVVCEQLSGLARVVRSNLQAGLENIALWHERDISHSSVERIILPDSFILVDYMLARMTRIIEGMRVFPEQMARNLETTKGLIFSQTVLLALADAGLSRTEAYRIVQRASMRVWEGEGDLRTLLRQEPKVVQTLGEEGLDGLFRADRLLKNVDRILERAGISRREEEAPDA